LSGSAARPVSAAVAAISLIISAVEKDVLCRILFLNLRVNNEKVVDFIWKEPFASLVKSVELSYGRDEQI
jgi:hypothetical protein